MRDRCALHLWPLEKSLHVLVSRTNLVDEPPLVILSLLCFLELLQEIQVPDQTLVHGRLPLTRNVSVHSCYHFCPEWSTVIDPLAAQVLARLLNDGQVETLEELELDPVLAATSNRCSGFEAFDGRLGHLIFLF